MERKQENKHGAEARSGAGVGKRLLSLLLTAAMLAGMIPAMTQTAAAASYTIVPKNNSTYPISGTNDYKLETSGTFTNYSITASGNSTLTIPAGTNLTIDNRSAGGSPIQVTSGTLTLVVNGSLTVYGQKAGAPQNNSVASPQGGAGAYAGINVPSGATVIIGGSGQVNAYGGDASAGASNITIAEGGLDNGVGGGGGAGAGIGGNGGAGGAYTNAGTSAQAAGTTWVIDSVTVKSCGGGGGSGGAGSLMAQGGGGGGGGYPAAGVGGGGAGGGSASGASGGGGFSGGGGESQNYEVNSGGAGGTNGGAGVRAVASEPTQHSGGGYFATGSGATTDLGGGSAKAYSGGGGGAGGKVAKGNRATLDAFNGSYITTAPNRHGNDQTPIYAQLGFAVGSIYSAGITTVQGRSAEAITKELSSIEKLFNLTGYGLGIGSGAGFTQVANGTYTVGNVPTTVTGKVSGQTTSSISFSELAGTGGTGNATKFRIHNVTNNTDTTVTGSTATVSGLTVGKEYSFQIYAINEYGESAVSWPLSAKTIAPPGAVTISSITRGNGQLTVNWSAPAGNGENASNYKLEVSENNSTWTTVSDAITGTSHPHNGLGTGKQYYYRVSAYNSAGWGSAGAVVSQTTYGLPGKPVPSVAADTKALVISWPEVDGDGQTPTYEVYEVNGGTESKISGATALTATTYKHNGLENNETHTYKVKAITGAGTTMSEAASGTTHNVPTVPRDVKAEVTEVYTAADSAKKAKVKVTWNPPSNDGGTPVTGYKVSWYANNVFAASETVGNVQEFTKDELVLGTGYTFHVSAINAAGEGREEYGTNSMVNTWNVPDPVRSPSGTSENGTLTLTWEKPASNNGQAVSRYAIYVYSTKEGADAEDENARVTLQGGNPVIVDGEDTTAKSIEGLDAGTKYFVRISATNSVGESSRTATYEVGVKAKPSAVSNIKVTPTSDTALEVTWSPANENGAEITHYVVQALDVLDSSKVVGTVTFADGDKLGTTTQKATITGLTTYRDYKIKIYAHNEQGDGEALTSEKVTTLRVPFEPQAVKAQSTGRTGEVKITWLPPKNNGGTPVTGYNVYMLETIEGGGESLRELATKLDASLREYTAKGLTDGQQYTFVVTATNQIGATRIDDPSDNAVSNQHNENNTDTATPRRPADMPQNVRAVIQSGTAVRLTWDAPENLGGSALKEYAVTVLAANGEKTGTVGAITVDQESQNGWCIVSELDMGGGYTFRVHAVTTDADGVTADLDGADAESNAVVLWRLPAAPDVSRMTAKPTNTTGEIDVAWYYPADDGDTVDTDTVKENHTSVAEYRLYWRAQGTDQYGTPAFVAQGEDIAQALTHTLTDLTDGTAYEIVVAAVNGAGEGEKSQPTLIATPRRVPEAPGVDGYAQLNEDKTLKTDVPYGAVTGDERATLSRIIPAPENENGKLGNGGDPITEYRVYATEAMATVENGFVTAAEVKVVGLTTEGAPIYAEPVLKTSIPVTGLSEAELESALSAIAVPDLQNGKDYILTVTAVNGAGEGTPSNATGVRVGMPETPDNLHVALATSSTTASNLLVQIDYDDANGNGSPVTRYDVEIVSDEGTKYGDDGVKHYTSTSNLFTGTMFGERLTLRVRAVNQYGESTWSEPVEVVIGSPEIPEITGTRLYQDRVDVSWNAVNNNGSKLERYLVYLDGKLIKVLGRGDQGYMGTGQMTMQIPKDGTNNAGEVESGLSTENYGPLQPGTTYRLQVAAQNVAGISPLSKAVEIRFGVPQAPTVENVTFADGSLTVRWKAPEDDGGADITAYRLYANGALKNELKITDTVDALDQLVPGKIYYDTANQTYAAKVSGLANGVDYSIQISAVNKNGEGALSSATANATPAKLAEAPRNLVALAASDKEAVLSWLAPSYNGGAPITGYVVKTYKVAEDGQATLDPSVTVEMAENKLSAKVSGLARGGKYYFTVHAVNKVNAAASDDGNAAKSETVTTFRLPGAPTITKLESIAPDVDNKNNWSVRVTWDAPKDNGGTPLTGYYVYSGTSRKSGLIDQNSFVITGMTYNQSYNRICVQAVNSVGATSSEMAGILVGQLLSPEVIGITTTVPPADSPDDTRIDVRWNKVDGVVDGYRIFALPDSVKTTAQADDWLRSHAAEVTTSDLSGVLRERWSGETVRFCVVAYNADMGNSAVSKIYEVVVGATSEPQGLRATPEKQAVKLTWSAPAEDNGGTIDGYQILIDGEVYTENDTNVFGTLEKTIPDLTGGKPYTFAVRAVSTQTNRVDASAEDGKATCHSLPSQTAEATPWADPTAPKLQSVVPGDGSFLLTFAEADGKGLPVTTGNYDIYLRPVDETTDPVKWDKLNFRENSDGTITVEVSGVENGKDYYVYAVAWTQYNSQSDVNYSVIPDLTDEQTVKNPELVQKVRTGVLAAPVITGVTAGVASATVTYTAPVDTTDSIRHYVVTYKASGGETQTATSQTTSCKLEGLQNGLLYAITVRAVNTNGDGTESEPVEVRVGTPLAPRIGAPQSGSNQAKIVWNPPASNNGGAVQMYKVYTTDDAGNTSFVYADAGKTETVLTELKNGVRYTVQVSAINTFGEGAKSASVEVMPGTVPGAIDSDSIKATAMGAESVQLTWSEPSDTGGLPIEGYEIAGGNLTEPLRVTDTTNALVGGLEKGVSYVFTIRAVNAVGAGPATSSPSVKTLTEPEVPAWRALTSANGTFTARWQPPASNGGAPVLEYLIRVYKPYGNTQIGETIAVTPDENNTIDGVIQYTGEPGGYEIGTEYEVTISARNSVGQSAESSRLSVVIGGEAAATVPGKPYNVAATAGNGSIDVSWSKPLYDGNLTIDGYRVYYYETADKDGTLKSLPVNGGSTTSASITGLKNGVSYSIYVLANNAQGNSVASDIVEASPYFIPAPGAPVDLTYKNNNTFNIMTVSWTAPASQTDETLYYNVYVNGELVTSSDYTSTSYTFQVPDANVGALYNIQVETVSAGGVSAKQYIKARSTLNVMSNNVGAPDTNLDLNPLDGELDEVAAAKAPDAPEIDTTNSRMLSGERKLHIEWAAPAYDGGAGIEGYRIYINSSKGSTVYDFSPANGNELTKLTYETGIDSGVIYIVRIAAYNEAGEGAYSDSLQMYLAMSNAPTGLRATKTSKTGIKLEWSKPNTGETPTEYIIQMNGEDKFTTNGSETSYTFGGVVNANYVFRVSAKYSGETSKATDAVRVSTTLLQPSAPAELQAQALEENSVPNGSIELHWNASAEDTNSVDYSAQVTGYRIYVNNAQVETINATRAASYDYTFAGTTGQDYVIHVTAVNAAGGAESESAKSNVVSATTRQPQAGAPSQITDLTATADQAAIDDKTLTEVPITLTWTPSTADEPAPAEEEAPIVTEEPPVEPEETQPETTTPEVTVPETTDPEPPAEPSDTQNGGETIDGEQTPAEDTTTGSETDSAIEIPAPLTAAAAQTRIEYAIKYSVDGGKTWEALSIQQSDITVDEVSGKCVYEWNDMENGNPKRGEYTFIVVPTAYIGEATSGTEGLSSNSATVSTLRSIPLPTAPDNIQAIFVDDGSATPRPSGKITVSFAAPSETEEVTAHHLYIDSVLQTSGVTWADGKCTFLASADKYAYAIQLSAVNETGEGPLSEVCQLNIARDGETDLTVPDAAAAVKFDRAASNGMDEIRLFWSGSADAQAAGYQIYVDGKPLVDQAGDAVTLATGVTSYTFGGKSGDGTLTPFYVLDGDKAVEQYVTSGKHTVQVSAIKYFSPTEGVLTDPAKIAASTDKIVVPGTLSNEKMYEWTMVVGLNVASNTGDPNGEGYWVADSNIDADGDGTRDTMGKVVRLTGTVKATGSAASVEPTITLTDAYNNKTAGTYDAATGTFTVEVNLGTGTGDEAAGTYTLTVSKDKCTTFTLTDIDLSSVTDSADIGEALLYTGDINGDGRVNVNDLSILNGLYDQIAEGLRADLNGDGRVNVNDLSILNGNYDKIGITLSWAALQKN